MLPCLPVLSCLQGDVDRVFLGKSSSPYHQVFRTDLLRLSTTDEPTQRFNLKELQVGTQAVIRVDAGRIGVRTTNRIWVQDWITQLGLLANRDGQREQVMAAKSCGIFTSSP